MKSQRPRAALIKRAPMSHFQAGDRESWCKLRTRPDRRASSSRRNAGRTNLRQIDIVKLMRPRRDHARPLGSWPCGTNEDAIVAAARTRFTPIIMTSFATVIGLLPTALGLEAGTEAN